MPWTFERVAGPYTFTEGPAWTGQTLLFTDIRNNRIMRFNPAIGTCDVFRVTTYEANGLHIDRAGNLYAGEGGGRRVVRYEGDGGSTVIADSVAGSGLNSVKHI